MANETRKVRLIIDLEVEAETQAKLMDDSHQVWIAEMLKRGLDLDEFWGEQVIEVTVEGREEG